VQLLIPNDDSLRQGEQIAFSPDQVELIIDINKLSQDLAAQIGALHLKQESEKSAVSRISS
ncbi:MAG: hypothetical protein AB8B67_04965, partial [Rickettsiaceae bacterium]